MKDPARTAKRLDAIVSLPLAAFRRAVAAMSVDDLVALQARIDLLTVAARWARGSHGVARHRSPNALGRLARRSAETRREIECRRAYPALRVLDANGANDERLLDTEDQAA